MAKLVSKVYGDALFEEAMEKGFEELSLKGSEDYIAMITVACKPRE